MGKVLLFGGTFDPPHKGHRHLLLEALKQADFDRVLLIPTYLPPHKEHAPVLSFELRKEILKSWFSDIPKLEISDIEEKRGGKSYTVDTISAIEALYPEDELYLLLGSDMFLEFETWRSFEILLSSVFLIVGMRHEGELPVLEAFKSHLMERCDCKGISLCSMNAVELASSELRGEKDGPAERALTHISRNLSMKRARHTLRVADYARSLAEKIDYDPEKAYLAGLLHDCTKCFEDAWHLRYAAEQGYCFTEDDLACPQMFHQITAPYFAREEFNVHDDEILDAIGCHTTGRVGMTILDMILFFADSCEPDRNYPDVEELRKAGEDDIKNGMLILLEHIIISLVECEKYLHPQTVAARNYLYKELEKNE